MFHFHHSKKLSVEMYAIHYSQNPEHLLELFVHWHQWQIYYQDRLKKRLH